MPNDKNPSGDHPAAGVREPSAGFACAAVPRNAWPLQQDLEQQPGKYFDLFQMAPVGFFLLDADGVILDANHTAATLLGTSISALMRRKLIRFAAPQHQAALIGHLMAVLSTGQTRDCELALHGSDGSARRGHLALKAGRAARGGAGSVIAAFLPIGGHHGAATKSSADRNAFDICLAECTAALERAQADLLRSIQANHSMQQQIEKQSAELEVRTSELAESNATLRVLMRQWEMERENSKEKIVRSINELVRPFLTKLAARKLGARERSLLDIVQRNLDDLVSPLPPRLIMEPGRLSPAETQVVNLIRQGKTSKDIAELMGVAPSTIDFHRHNIRRKLRLSKKSLNLRTYLNTLE